VHQLKRLLFATAAIVAAAFAVQLSSPDPSAAARARRTAVVVTFADADTARRALESTLAPGSRSLGRQLVLTTGSAEQISSLRHSPGVLAVDADATYHATEAPNDPCYSATNRCAGMFAWQTDALHLPRAWDLSKGSGTTIAVIDGGIDDGYEDLAAKLAAPETDLVGPQAFGDPSDHATAVAALAAAAADNGVGIPGAGWDARLLSYRVLSASSPGGAYSGSLSDIVTAIVDATDRGATVINLSVSGPDTTALRTAVAYALDRGVTVVAAAGNDGSSEPTFPAAYDRVVAVGALDGSGRRASFSNFGPWVDVFAPGEHVVAPGRRSSAGTERMLTLDGTSFSAALVAGVSALLDARTPGLDSATVGTVLHNSGSELPAENGMSVDAEQALRSRAPFGWLDLFHQVPGGAIAAGWAIDPDARAPISVDIMVDGVSTRAVAALPRPDLAGFGLGTDHGFTVTAPIGEGAHTLCARALNDGRGAANTDLGCRSVYIPSIDAPFGVADFLRRVPGGVRPEGWAMDPSTYAPAMLDISVNGTAPLRAHADGARPDVGNVYPGFGANRGFPAGVTLAAPPGSNEVCVWAIDTPSTASRVLLGCVSLFVSNDPTGVVDLVSRTSDGIRVVGWTLDPDVASATDAHVYIDGIGVAIPSEGARADIAAAFPGYGATHGFDRTFTTGPEPRTVCIAAANVGPGNSSWIGCREV
jgi:Subtilase family